MKKLKKYGRLWHFNGDEALLSPWAENINQTPGILIKKNQKRSVWRVNADDGESYFVKHEFRFHVPFTLSKAEKEFNAFLLLKEKEIPCAEYTAWTAASRDCIVVSRALPDRYTSILQYWYSQENPDMEFAGQLCKFLGKISKAGLTHPDFHAGNLMTDGQEIVLIDPVGIKSALSTNAPDSEMLIPLNILCGDIPSDTLAEMLHGAGLYSNRKEALERLEEMELRQKNLINGEWEKREKQILKGSSKFSFETEPGRFVRNTAWFSRISETGEKDLETVEYSPEEGKKIWTESFRAQLLKKKCDRIPVICSFKGEKVKISYLKGKKNSFLYGFR